MIMMHSVQAIYFHQHVIVAENDTQTGLLPPATGDQEIKNNAAFSTALEIRDSYGMSHHDRLVADAMLAVAVIRSGAFPSLHDLAFAELAKPLSANPRIAGLRDMPAHLIRARISFDLKQIESTEMALAA